MPSLKELSAWWETVLQKGPASRPGLEQAMGVERPGVGVWGEEFGQHPLEAGAVTSVVTVPPLISPSERLSESESKGLGKSNFG